MYQGRQVGHHFLHWMKERWNSCCLMNSNLQIVNNTNRIFILHGAKFQNKSTEAQTWAYSLSLRLEHGNGVGEEKNGGLHARPVNTPASSICPQQQQLHDRCRGSSKNPLSTSRPGHTSRREAAPTLDLAYFQLLVCIMWCALFEWEK
jgi:hypothetical protein